MEMEHKYLQTTGTRKWKEDEVPQEMARYFFRFFLAYQYISTLQGKDCKTDPVPDHCFISQRIMPVYAFSVSIGDFQRKLSITYCRDTRNTHECKFIPNSRVFSPEDDSLGLGRQFSCGFAED